MGFKALVKSRAPILAEGLVNWIPPNHLENVKKDLDARAHDERIMLFGNPTREGSPFIQFYDESAPLDMIDWKKMCRIVNASVDDGARRGLSGIIGVSSGPPQPVNWSDMEALRDKPFGYGKEGDDGNGGWLPQFLCEHKAKPVDFSIFQDPLVEKVYNNLMKRIEVTSKFIGKGDKEMNFGNFIRKNLFRPMSDHGYDCFLNHHADESVDLYVKHKGEGGYLTFHFDKTNGCHSFGLYWLTESKCVGQYGSLSDDAKQHIRLFFNHLKDRVLADFDFGNYGSVHADSIIHTRETLAVAGKKKRVMKKKVQKVQKVSTHPSVVYGSADPIQNLHNELNSWNGVKTMSIEKKDERSMQVIAFSIQIHGDHYNLSVRLNKNAGPDMPFRYFARLQSSDWDEFKEKWAGAYAIFEKHLRLIDMKDGKFVYNPAFIEVGESNVDGGVEGLMYMTMENGSVVDGYSEIKNGDNDMNMVEFVEKRMAEMEKAQLALANGISDNVMAEDFSDLPASYVKGAIKKDQNAMVSLMRAAVDCDELGLNADWYVKKLPTIKARLESSKKAHDTANGARIMVQASIKAAFLALRDDLAMGKNTAVQVMDLARAISWKDFV